MFKNPFFSISHEFAILTVIYIYLYIYYHLHNISFVASLYSHIPPSRPPIRRLVLFTLLLLDLIYKKCDGLEYVYYYYY